MKKLFILFIFACFIILALSTATFASDTSGATYTGTIRVTNDGTANTSVATIIYGINSTSFISNGYLNATATDSTIQHSGTDVKYMPGYGSNLWIMWVSSIGGTTYYDDKLYTPNVTGSDIVYFPGDGGMTVSDDASLEPGSGTFSINLNRWIDTTSGDGKYIFWHGDNFTCYVSNTTSGTINVVVGNVTLTTTGISSGEHTIIVTLEQE